MDTYTGGSYSTAPFLDMPLNHKVFLAQFDAIKKIAANESCVIVGRCADYALADEPHCLNIFIRSNMDDRIKRISERLNVPENKAKDIIKKKDKERSSYYNYYTSIKRTVFFHRIRPFIRSKRSKAYWSRTHNNTSRHRIRNGL